MPNTVGPAKYTPASKADRRAIIILDDLFSKDNLVASFLNANDTVPNHDGYLELLNASGEQKGTIFAQVKSSLRYNKDGKIKHSLDSKFLSYCSTIKDTAIIFIGVDRDDKKAYWVEMTPALVKEPRQW